MDWRIQSLQLKLPEMRRWVEQTVATHRTEARSVASYGFPRLGQFYRGEMLALAKVVALPRVPVPPLTNLGIPGFAEFERLDSLGITYLDTYFVQTDSSRHEWLHFHELVHVIQWQLLGPNRFLMAYAVGHLLFGYNKNPLEMMAYDLQGRFQKQAAPFDAEEKVRSELEGKVATLLEQLKLDR